MRILLLTSKSKAWFLGFMLLAGTSLCYAQSTLNFGTKGGLNFATQFGDTYSELGFRTGIILGGYLEMPYNDNFSFQAELSFSQEGARNANYDFSDFSSVIYDQKLKYNYLTAPLLVKYNVMEKLNVQAGFQLGFNIVAKESRRIKSGTPSPTDHSAGTRLFTDRIKFIYPSMTIGAEYQLMDRVKVQTRFFFSVFDNVKKTAGDSEGTFPLIFQFTGSYELFQKEVKGLPKP